jgi:hypothetical protein
MIILIYNRSRKKRFRSTKRIISSVLPSISNRLNIGSIPKRVIEELILDLKKFSGRGTAIEIYIENKDGYHGFELCTIGKFNQRLDIFEVNKKFS